ncbi:MAG: hypothetical protein ACO3P1_15245, partial [Pseudomonadales bacterium]
DRPRGDYSADAGRLGMTHERKSSLELCFQDRAKDPAMITAHFPPFEEDNDTVHGRRKSLLEEQPAQDDREDEES